MFTPSSVPGIWFRGLLPPVIIGLGIYLLLQWYDRRETSVVEPIDRSVATERQSPTDGTAAIDRQQYRVRVVRWHFGWNRETALLVGGLVLFGWAIGGGRLLSPQRWRRIGNTEPTSDQHIETERLPAVDGSELRVLMYGPIDGDTIVMTHGWGLDHNEWCYLKNTLGKTHRLIVWDLPGLGESERPRDRDWSLERLAQNLDRVISLAGNKPVMLLGHSIGVMTTLTYCKLFPEALGTRVNRLILAQGTYTNPLRTTKRAWLYSALEKPVVVPLCTLMIWLSPIVRVMNWMSYINGSAHRSTERDSFSGRETRGQLDFMAKYYVTSPPDVIGRGMLAMLRYDATAVLSRIPIPTLIVAGDHDGSCLPEASRFMAEAIPQARLVELKDSKHCGLFEHHEAFAAAIQGFLPATTELPPALVRV